MAEQSNGAKRGENIFKKFKIKREDIFFGLHIQYVGMSLKLTAPAKMEKFTDKEKKQEKCLRLLSDLSAWQIGEVTVAVFGILEILQKKKEKQNGGEADTSMTLLCWKAPWSLTFGGLSTSSEVERLVPSSHATAEEKERFY